MNLPRFVGQRGKSKKWSNETCPRAWLGVIDQARRLRVDRFVPGRGFIEPTAVSRRQLLEFRGALAAVTAEAHRPAGLELSVEQAMSQAESGPYATWMRANSQRIVALRSVFAAVERP